MEYATMRKLRENLEKYRFCNSTERGLLHSHSFSIDDFGGQLRRGLD
jgi:hypothetical protein